MKKAKDGLTDKKRAELAIDALKKEYPEGICSLIADEPFQLLVATRLSAQCTDARVNMITPALFAKYPTIEDFANADVADVEQLIHSCGFFRQKAKDIVGMANMILSEYGGKVPDTIEELTKLPGVGRKTANLIIGDVYKKPAVVADTHLIRISNRLGLVSVKDPYKVEMKLKEILDPAESNDFCHRCVLHGRAVCAARKPRCEKCVMKDFCLYYFEQNS
ncbi:MAG: endonuclease III [Clostridiales bacterium]|nr:endonuclease III [Clostridiales bacterium]HOA33622.1 endonuclease III [Clostridiales bacterium]HOJ36227.1 endonuclease III [Clostridiales bacterium]HOL78900.1 endonuclease III [Clostridiales bacterium]HPP68996.1 endonuclease III [Clostridiales bacterium]